jgi:hypothetical protein
LVAAGRATLATWDPRLALKGWQPLAADVRVDIVEDRDAHWVDEGWLDPLLRTDPRSRVRLDTPLLRREHWWYLPRWVVTVTAIERVWPLARREGPQSGLLAWSHAGTVAAEVVTVDDWDDDPLAVHLLGAAGGLDRAAGAAALQACDVRTPDLDHTVALSVRGRLDASLLHVLAREGQAELGRPPSLLRRLAEARALERACRRAIDAADARAGRA